MPQIGHIISWPNYPFPDGTTSNKLFLVINNSSSSNDPCLFIFATTYKERYRNYHDGCNVSLKCFHIPLSWGEPFREPTFIMFPQIIETTCQRLWGRYADGVYLLRRKVSNTCMEQIKECLQYFSDDISERNKSLMFI